MANLIVDEGNTLCKIGVVDNKEVVCEVCNEEFDMAVVMQLLERYSLQQAIVASTRGNGEYIRDILHSQIERVLYFTSQTEVPIAIEYTSRQTLGTDRIAAAVGAICGLGVENALIVDMGSAITFDIVEGGIFRGGNIAPGVGLRFWSLNKYAAQLPLCEAGDITNSFGSSTAEAIEQGVMQGVLFEIEGYVERVLSKNSENSIIFCGGDAKYFVNRIKNAIFAGRKLMFTGLNEILEYNVCKGNI